MVRPTLVARETFRFSPEDKYSILQYFNDSIFRSFKSLWISNNLELCGLLYTDIAALNFQIKIVLTVNKGKLP